MGWVLLSVAVWGDGGRPARRPPDCKFKTNVGAHENTLVEIGGGRIIIKKSCLEVKTDPDTSEIKLEVCL